MWVVIRHFNRVVSKGVDPNMLEDKLSIIESDLAVHLKEVISARSFPSGEHRNSIMTLIAMLSARNPRLRAVINKSQKDIENKITDLVFSSKDVFDRQKEEMKRFHEEGNYELGVKQTHLIDIELRMLEPLFELLMQRNWCFVSAAPNTQFICSDDPVVLKWSKDELGNSPYGPLDMD